MTHRFLQRSRPISLAPFDKASFWVVDLAGIEVDEVYEAQSFLDHESLARAKRLIFEEDQHRAIITHALLRFHLAEHIQKAPHHLKITRNESGKPFLKDGELHFNLSHSMHYAFFGMHPTRPIGVDIEMINGIDILGLVDVFAYPSEKEKIMESSSEPKDRFFSLWCAKEAFLKAAGTGFLVAQLPFFDFESKASSAIEIFTSMGLEVYVYNKIIQEHKLAVCLGFEQDKAERS